MKLANQLRELRSQSNLTQEQLADRVGVTRQTIIAVEKSKFIPSVKLALELARALGTPIDRLFWLQDDEGEGK
ncbi:MAG: helix-turn-helix transcriptional regulator [Anaerolineae bacterium]|jgi:putative transcriptional regulator|nr:helix-turn-helix transcriptional regulator [Anaerolineae bacterium]